MKQAVLRKGPEIRRRILLAVVFLTPLFFLRGSYDPFNVPKLWLLMIGVVIVAAIRCVELLQGADRSSLELLVVPASAIALALLIGTLFSPYRVWSLIGDHSRFTGLVPYLVVILLGILIADAFRGDVRLLAWALAASGGVAGGYAIVQVLGLDPLAWTNSNQPVVTIGNTNFAGAFFAICLPVAIGLVLVEDGRRPLAILLTALIVTGWLLSRSEAAWAAGASGILVIAGILLSQGWRFSRLVALVAVGVLATAGMSLVAVGMSEKPPVAVPQTLQRRAEWWEAALRMTSDSPIFGRGPNAFAIEHSHYRDVDDVEVAASDVTNDPHSVPVSFLTAAGVFGILGWITFAGWVLLTVAKADPNQRLGVAFGAAAVAYLVQSLLSIDVVTLRAAAWTVVGGMAAGLTLAVPPAAKTYPGKKRKKKRAAKDAAEPLKALPGVVGVILVSGIGIAWASGFLSADLSFRRGLSLASVGAPGAKENLESAVGFRDSNYTYRTGYGTLLGGNAVQEGLAEGSDQTVARELMQESTQAFAIVDRIPHANSVLAYARVMRDWAEVDGSAESEAMALYERALELDPNNFLILEEQAAAAEAFGRAELAAELAERAEHLRRSGS